MGRKQERDKNKEGGQRRIRRRKKRVDNSGQLVLYEASRTEGGVERPSGEQWRGVRKYDDPQPEGILIGREDLKSYLQRRGESRVLKLRELIRGLELKGFYQQAPKAGRRPYHPASMVGLILLGLMEGKSSLRQLEVMARTDIRSWWISGGIQPDHSVIGRFIQQHREQLSEGFFVELTREVLKRTGSRGGDLAGDGTVIQSAASRYRRLSQEAIEMAAQETEKASLQEPDNSELLAQKQRLQELAEKVKQQQKRRRSRSKRARKVSPSDPEAVIQPLSRGGPSAASYKPVVLSNEQQIVVAQELDASCEHAVFEQLLEQARQSSGKVERLRWDSGAFNFDVLKSSKTQGIELLCPEGATSHWGGQGKKTALYHKSEFRYDQPGDYYECPAGQRLGVTGKKGQDDGIRYRVYGGAPCQDCPQRSRCTSSQTGGRTIKRYEQESLKDELREKMKQSSAQREYQKRKHMVEPVFARIKQHLGLRRFSRRGLANVRMEFALYAAAHNLGRWLALSQPDLTPVFRLLRAIFSRKTPRTGPLVACAGL